MYVGNIKWEMRGNDKSEKCEMWEMGKNETSEGTK